MLDIDFDDQTIHQRDDDRPSITKFLGDIDLEEVLDSSTALFESNQPPWRVALDVLDAEVQIVFDLRVSMVLGRSYPQTTPFDGIDFSPFDAYKNGLSRQHAVLILEGSNVIIRDMNSRNGTALNGKWLTPDHSYVLKSGDRINLAKLKLRIQFLYSPFVG